MGEKSEKSKSEEPLSEELLSEESFKVEEILKKELALSKRAKLGIAFGLSVFLFCQYPFAFMYILRQMQSFESRQSAVLRISAS